MGMISCPQCGVANDDRLMTCLKCGAPMPRPTKAPWKLGLYVLSAFLIVPGILFLWAAPVANTAPRLIMGITMIVLGVIILLLGRSAGRSQRYYSETIENGGLVNGRQLTCKVCGATLGEDSLSLINGVPKLVCPNCKRPYHVEEEPKW